MIYDSLPPIKTPMGEIVCKLCDDPNYPAFHTFLITPDGEEILLSAVEYEKEDETIGICSYYDMSQDEPVYHERIDAEDIQQYLRNQ